jgi:hypothetical protein
MAASLSIAAQRALGRILMSIISKAALDRRNYWVSEIERLSGDFGEDSERLAPGFRKVVTPLISTSGGLRT